MSETEVTLLTGKYTISTSVTKSITISKDATVEISIPENVTPTNTAGKHTITNNGTLTITGSGTVDNVSHERGALVNEPGATATLNGCTFTRSEEAGTDNDHANGNSWYTIKNYGTMTVGKNTVVTTGSSDQVEKYSSLIANGWQNDNDLKSHPKVSGQSTANMTVEGGAFSRGLNTIKNDDYGALTISGGSFTNYTQAALQNHSVATVSNGKFDADSDYAIYNCPCDENADKGELSISGGDFKGTIYSTKADGYGFLKVTGGTFSDPGVYQYAESGTVNVKLQGNYIGNKAIPISSGVTANLDLNGHVMAVPDCGITARGAFTLTDSGNEGKHQSEKMPVMIVGANGIFILNSGSVVSTGNYGVYAKESGSAVVNGGSIKSKNAALSGNNTTGDMNFTVNGGILTAEQGPAIYMPGQVSFTVAGGTLNGGISLRMGQVNISGGTINAISTGIDSPNGKVATSIAGGTFSSEPDASYIADGYEAVKSGANWVVQVPYTPAPAPSTETTTTTVTDKKTGESTSTTEGVNGTTVVEKTDASGNTTTKVTVPEGAATNAGAPVEIPAAVEVTKGKEVSISAPAGTIVAIPAAADAGNVAVIVHADGTETVIPMSLVEGGKAIVKLDGDETIKIVDNAKDFSDVPAEHWAADDIDFASSHEIFKGIGNGDTYEPETALTRNMMMTVLARTAGADTSESDPWYAKGREWAVENGVSNGLWGEDNITREQLVTMLFNFANLCGLDISARADVSGMVNADVVSDWATEAVQWAVAEGILKGVDNIDLAPQGLATRAQAAAFMQRYVSAVLL